MKNNTKPKVLNVLLWLASVAAMIGIMILGSNLFEENDLELLIEFIVITIVTLLFLYLISGKKTFTFFKNRTGYTIKMLLPTLIFPAIFFFFGLVSLFADRPGLAPNWQINVLLSSLSLFLVGIYEEGCFRACACDAMLPAFRKFKHPFLLTALISGLVFGWVHVVSADFSDLQQTLQFILKIATLAISGASYMILYWKTRNLLGLAIVHCLNDLLPEILSQMFVWNIKETDGYISGDAGTTVIYAVQLAFNLFCLIHIYRHVGKTIDYKKTLEEW